MRFGLVGVMGSGMRQVVGVGFWDRSTERGNFGQMSGASL